MEICKIEGCEKQINRSGDLCPMHYGRKLRTGNTRPKSKKPLTLSPNYFLLIESDLKTGKEKFWLIHKVSITRKEKTSISKERYFELKRTTPTVEESISERARDKAKLAHKDRSPESYKRSHSGYWGMG